MLPAIATPPCPAGPPHRAGLTRRHAGLALAALAALVAAAAGTAVRAQIPPGAQPQPPQLPPMPPQDVPPGWPGQPAQSAQPGQPGQFGQFGQPNGSIGPGAGSQLPHAGHLPNAPGSAAASRGAGLPTVAIREFRSSVNEVSPRGATDMFIAALVRSRRFRVLERARLAEGIATEKALNQQGMTTGQVGQSQYTGAAYLFEATVSEASSGDRKSSFALGLAGATAGRGSTTDSIAIDVRVTDVESGVVVDAVTVRKALQSVETRVAGVSGALAHLATRGRGSALADALSPDDAYVNARKDSLDRGLREAIDVAVGEIARRFGSGP